MDNDNRKIITVSFVATGFIAFLTARVIFQFLAINFGFFGRLWSEVSFQHGVPVVFAVAMFLTLEFNSKIKKWADEVVTEIRKVVWPAKNQTIAMTIVTCIMVVTAGVVLGVFDLVSTEVVSQFINLSL